MRNPNTEIASIIKAKTLELLMEKEPTEIGMREIAKECLVTATTLYNYYKDKESIFQTISRDSIKELNEIILNETKNFYGKEKFIFAGKIFKNWCLENPRRALLLFSKIQSDLEASEELLEEYYLAHKTAVSFLVDCINQGVAVSENPLCDISIFISGLWGCIESVILKKSDKKYWNDCSELCDRFINMWMKSVFIK